ncbi:aldehyde dehydrogenase family protein [Cupriavidus sp. LEh25]|nr:aldehyde dehydrogenase family protein [Cupriavidus sp. LEh25]
MSRAAAYCQRASAAWRAGDTAERLLPALVERARTLKIGNGLQPDAEIGPVVTRAALERIEGYIGVGVEEGASLLLDGRGLRVEGHEPGFFTGATLFDHVTPEMRIYREEVNSRKRPPVFDRRPFSRAPRVFTGFHPSPAVMEGITKDRFT